MPVVKSVIKARIKTLILSNKNEEDLDKAVENFSDELSSIIRDAILSATITAPTGSIITVGSPVTQSNANPIILKIT